MSEMTMDQAVWLRDLYLKALEIESATTARVLQAVPATAGEYRPDAASRSAMDLLRHIAGADIRFVETVLNGESLVKPVNFRGMFTRPAVTYLQMGLHHTIHHRGQLSAYLRSMGAKVPSIYGESYDATQARLAAGT